MNIRDALKTETATTLRCEAEAQDGIERDETMYCPCGCGGIIYQPHPFDQIAYRPERK
jgi:hypothetical protein